MRLRELQTERLCLRRVRDADLDALHALWTDPGVRRFLWDDLVITRERADEALQAALRNEAERGFGLWTLQLRQGDGRDGADGVMGFCGFAPMEDRAEIELLYGVLPEHWGQGLAVEASRAALDELFTIHAPERHSPKRHSPKRVWALADPPNTQSFRVMEKLGMRFAHDGEANGLPARFYVLERGAGA
jgi:ribosomal-protein-alanine N-acetyltransferase